MSQTKTQYTCNRQRHHHIQSAVQIPIWRVTILGVRSVGVESTVLSVMRKDHKHFQFVV